VTLADTAGLRESADLVEGIGIERAREAARSADIILYLIDATDPEPRPNEYPDALVIYSKADLNPQSSILTPQSGSVAISAVTDHGIDELMCTLDDLVRSRFAAPEGSLVNERQSQAVQECGAALRTALDSLSENTDEQMVLVDLYRAANALGLLTGAITREDVLTEIFGKFCIGK
jgi:tRNA modification GTPase